MSLRFIHVVAWVRIPLLFKAEKYSIICIDHILLLHSSVEGHLGYFHLLAIGIMLPWPLLRVSAWVRVFNCSGHIQKSRVLSHMVILCLTFWGTTMLFPLTLIFQIANSESKFSQLLIHAKSRFECLLCARHQGYSSKGNRKNPCPLRVYILLSERQ